MTIYFLPAGVEAAHPALTRTGLGQYQGRQYLLAKRMIRIITPVSGRKGSGSKTIRKLLGGLIGESLCFGNALR